MHRFDSSVQDPMEELFEHIMDAGVGTILETASFQALHARLCELMRPLAQGIVDEYEEHADGEMLDRITRAIATRTALDLWNHTPIPDNHFRPHRPVKAERNAPCPCGSQRKYKQCCGAVDAPSLHLPPDEMAARVLKRLPPERIGEIAAHGLSPHTLGMVAKAWIKEQRHDAAVALLEPLFDDLRRLDERAVLAADALADAYFVRGDDARREQLVARLKGAPDKTLRSTAFQREATMSSDRGDHPAAWAAFRQAQRLTPDDPTLAHLEILLLLSEGRDEEARSRVEFWSARLARDPEYDHSELIALLHQMLERPWLDDAAEDARLAELPQDYPERRLVLRVELEGITPPIWRRLEVENTLTFADLHLILQAAMGWEDAHLHEFVVGDRRIGPPSDEFAPTWEEPPLPGDEVEIGQVLGRRKSFTYIYDFGDDWSHRIAVEKRLPSRPLEQPAALLGGERACPPEDCGGVYGYGEVLDALAHPDDEARRETLEWLDGYAPEAFSLASASKQLASLFERI